MAKFQKGQGGRTKGSKNKVTKAVREAVVDALNEGRGAVAFFVKLKNSRSAEDRRCFAHVCARLIPTEIKASVIPVLAADPDDFLEIGRKAAFLLHSAQIAQRRAAAVIPLRAVDEKKA